jgi:hypothetical protein
MGDMRNYLMFKAEHPLSCFNLEKNMPEIGLCPHLQVKPILMDSINTASPYLQTPAPTSDRVYKPNTAQTICES